MSVQLIARRLAVDWSRPMLFAGVGALTATLAAPAAQAMGALTQGSNGLAAVTAAQNSLLANQQGSATVMAQAQNSLSRAVQALQAIQALQTSAHNLKLAAPDNTVPNGLAAGGLEPDSGLAAAGTANQVITWQGAATPTQTVSGNQTTVSINQTAQQAILNWKTFNVGAGTTVAFNQQGHTNWTALNQIPASGVPSQILGAIKASGQVFLINPNGIIFGGSAQVNVGALLASSAEISNAQYLATGIYSTQSNGTYNPSFSHATGAITVEAGAQLTTAAPFSVTQGGGFVLLMGTSVQNAGSITTPQGQAELAAGRNFVLRPGLGSDGNAYSTTAGNEIAPVTATLTGGTLSYVPGGGGDVINTGFISAPLGDVTLAGRTLTQAGVLVATSSVSTRGTLHLLTSASDPKSSVTLAPGSTTAILLDTSGGTALDSQREAAIAATTAPSITNHFPGGTAFDDLSTLPDRTDLSRIEIVTGGTVEFAGGSLTLATGGQVAVSAVSRIEVDAGAAIDVAGSEAVLPASADNLAVNIQGFELRDAPVSRDTSSINSANVEVDTNLLTLVPAGTDGYASDRYYTPGGLLEVSGELANVGHSVAEFDSLGGTITLNTGTSGSVVAQAGAVFNISGGAITYQAGYLTQSYLRASDGGIFNVNDAPANLSYTGVYNGFVEAHPAWGVSNTFNESLHLPAQIYQAGYTVGKDAGALILSTPTAIFQASIDAGTITGAGQTAQRNAQTEPSGAAADPFLLSPTTAPLAGSLVFGQYTLASYTLFQTSFYTNLLDPSLSSVTFAADAAAANISASEKIPKAELNTAVFDAPALNVDGLGGITVLAGRNIRNQSVAAAHPVGNVSVAAPLVLAPGGSLTIAAANVHFNADVTVPDGSISVGYTTGSGDFLEPLIEATSAGTGSATPATPPYFTAAGITLAAGAVLDTSGLWTNALGAPAAVSGLAYLNGGAVSLVSQGGVKLLPGSLIDTSSGGAILGNGKILPGQGGNVTLTANSLTFDFNGPPSQFYVAPSANALLLEGSLESYGMTKGGTLTLTGPKVEIGGIASAAPRQTFLPLSFFDQGFSNYDINGQDGLSVAPGAVLNVTEPVAMITAASYAVPTGASPAQALSVMLPAVYIDNPASSQLTQRAGAGLSLRSVISEPGYGNGGGSLSIGAGAVINLDPAQSFLAQGYGQVTLGVAAQIHAPGGSISLLNTQALIGAPFSVSVWIGNDSLLDVSGRAVTAVNSEGLRYGIAPAGGTVTLGGTGSLLNQKFDNNGTLQGSTDAFVVIRPGAQIEANGAQASIDVVLGEGGLRPLTTPVILAGNGGTISLSSYSGIYNDGILSAAAGGANASGGLLAMTLDTPNFTDTAQGMAAGDPHYHPIRIISVSQNAAPSGLPADLKIGDRRLDAYKGTSNISVQQITAGGFATVALWSRNSVLFEGNVTLTTSRAIELFEGPYSETKANDNVTLNAPYVLLAGDNGQINPASSTPQPGSAPSKRSGSGIFTVNADLIDTEDSINFGNSLTAKDYAGFNNVDLNSSGDIRLNGGFQAPYNLTLRAAQIYSTGVADVSAGQYTNAQSITAYRKGTSLTLERNGSLPAVPFAALGQLSLSAATINQGGVIQMPEGIIGFNAKQINLLPGSLTSVGTAGFAIPYGGSADGVTYNAVGSTAGTPFTLQFFKSGITFSAPSVTIEGGAVVNLSGGGALLGSAFVSGRGGSVDSLLNPLLSFNAANGSYSAPALAQDPIYAILPGTQGTAPQSVVSNVAYTGLIPGIGDQVTIQSGAVPGLAAGTYTLLPSVYALLPGAFRVEFGAVTTVPVPSLKLLNGSYQVAGYRGVANSAIRATLPNVLTITPAATVLTYADYNQETYDNFALQNAAQTDQGPPVLLADSKTLNLELSPLPGRLSFINQGTFVTAAGPGGAGLLVNVTEIGGSYASKNTIEIVDTTPTKPCRAGSGPDCFSGVSIAAASLDDLNADTLNIAAGNSSNLLPGSVVIRGGAVLGAPQVLLTANAGTITLDPGAVIDTLGYGATSRDYAHHFTQLLGLTTLDVSNGQTVFLPGNDLYSNVDQTRPITVAAGAEIFSQGSIAFATNQALNISTEATLGTRSLIIGGTNINFLPAAGSGGAVVPDGVVLNNQILSTLLQGSTANGAPALQSLVLTAQDSVNFFGTVNLDTTNPATGQSSLAELVINAPGIYGYGGAGDVATLTTGTLIWNGVGTVNPLVSAAFTNLPEPPAIAGGPGSGQGILNIVASQIIFGYPSLTLPQNTVALGRTILGFSTVNLTATTAISSNNNGTLGVYQSQGYDAATNSISNSGGNLNLITPVLTGDSGSILAITAGNALNLTSPDAQAANPGGITTLGATLTLNAGSIAVDTAIALPSGSLSLNAGQGITLGSNADIDLSGRDIALFDVQKYTGGGTVKLASAQGGITEAAGALIDVSATGAAAGSITLSATNVAISLDGSLSGASPVAGGTFSVAAQSFGDFDTLNGQLDSGGFYGARSFDLRQGSLVVDQTVRAQTVDISVDAGSLTVDGLIDASGPAPGSIRLAGQTGLSLGPAAQLDAQGTVLQTDSYGAPIDAENRAVVELTSASGALQLAPGSRIDLASPDGVSRGQLILNAPRNAAGNGILINATGPIAITGAASIALNGFRTYTSSTGIIGQADFNGFDADSRAFIEASWANPGFLAAISGLTAYGSAFHLRPGVEVDATGNLTLSGSLDFSGFRYGPSGQAQDEPGSLVLRAGGNLVITGSINDGFDTNGLPANNQWTLQGGNPNSADVIAALGGTLPAGTTLAPGAILSFALEINPNDVITYPSGTPALASGTVLPVMITLAASHEFTSSFVATGTVTNAAGDVLYQAGDYVEASTAHPVTLRAGDSLGIGFTLPVDNQISWTFSNILIWPKGIALPETTDPNVPEGTDPLALPTDETLAPGSTIPAGTTLPYGAVFTLANNAVDYSLAPPQALGTQSWSYRLVGGADLGAADTRIVNPYSQLDGSGNVLLSDPHSVDNGLGTVPSFIRTGTGSIDIIAGGNYSQSSLYGIYTAGAAVSDNTDSGYALSGGGNVLISAQNNLTSYGILTGIGQESAYIGFWLWRQAGPGYPTSWGIDTLAEFDPNSFSGTVGFTGFGTLGGGNLTIEAGGDAGILNYSGSASMEIDAAVASSGSVVNGKLTQYGGGRLLLQVGGGLNPGNNYQNFQSLDSFGTLTDLRGDLDVQAGSIGRVGVTFGQQYDQRVPNPFAAGPDGLNSGNINFYLGDSVATVTARGDLATGFADNPGAPFSNNFAAVTDTVFSLWTGRTALDLTSLGGNLSLPMATDAPQQDGPPIPGFIPSKLSAVAVTGNIFAAGASTSSDGFELAPSATGQLQLIAGQSVFDANGNGQPLPINISGADPATTATIFTPLYLLSDFITTNASPDSTYGFVGFLGGYLPLVAYGPDTPTTALHAADATPAQIYAVNGDIVTLQFGARETSPADPSETWYIAAKPAEIRAGNDITFPDFSLYGPTVILNNIASDISSLTAGQDIFYATADIAGPGLLVVQAGHDVYQGAQGQLESLGPLFDAAANPDDGAGISVLAGVGAAGPDYADFARLYLDPANLANPAVPLAQQPGKVAMNYDDALLAWLQGRFATAQKGIPAFTGDTPAAAYAYFQTLPADQQAVFVRQIFYAELTLSGREYNDPSSRLYRSYLRGREAIANLFPATSASGQPLTYSGDFIQFSAADPQTGAITSAFVRTDFGGDIQTLTPGGESLIGVEGVDPGPNAGLLTQGSGNIDIYALDSILLGQSRIFTTFGGNILAWSATGDINAGRGAKTTQVYAPPRRIYDIDGNVTLSPVVPTTGAGIATLNPIPQVPPGDIDLVAPLGTIDAGEAGIRVSGNLNIAALHVLNAANIQVQGKSTGVPVAPAPDIGALSAAGNAAGAAQAAGANSVKQHPQAVQPSIWIVEILGYGGSDDEGAPRENKKKG